MVIAAKAQKDSYRRWMEWTYIAIMTKGRKPAKERLNTASYYVRKYELCNISKTSNPILRLFAAAHSAPWLQEKY